MKSCCEHKSAELKALHEKQSSVLKIVLAINAGMFVIEFTMGWIAHSTALLGDSLDMLGDAIVYAFTLYVLERSIRWQAVSALLKGIIITIFGFSVMGEAVYKLFSDIVPIPQTMGLIGFLALVANGTCLFLLFRHRNDNINLRSTYICSRNDIISNVGVLIAAVAVSLTGSKWPDIIVGFVIASLFLRSAWPILKEAILALRQETAN